MNGRMNKPGSGLTIRQSARIDDPAIANTAAMRCCGECLRHALSYFHDCPIQIDALADEELSG
jgi:hypothetical protein